MNRPTETLTGPALGAAVYAFAHDSVHLPVWLCAVLAVIAAFGPLVISQTVDRIRGDVDAVPIEAPPDAPEVDPNDQLPGDEVPEGDLNPPASEEEEPSAFQP